MTRVFFSAMGHLDSPLPPNPECGGRRQSSTPRVGLSPGVELGASTFPTLPGRAKTMRRNLPLGPPFPRPTGAEPMHILYPHEVKQQPAVAPLELDDDLTRRDSWMFAPLIAIAVALPMVV